MLKVHLEGPDRRNDDRGGKTTPAVGGWQPLVGPKVRTDDRVGPSSHVLRKREGVGEITRVVAYGELCREEGGGERGMHRFRAIPGRHDVTIQRPGG